MAIQLRNAAHVNLQGSDVVLNAGELHLSNVTVNADCDAAKQTLILGTGGAAGITVTLPDAGDALGKVYIVRKVDAGAGAVTVAPAGGDDIDGGGSVALAGQWDTIVVVSDGVTTWHWVA